MLWIQPLTVAKIYMNNVHNTCISCINKYRSLLAMQCLFSCLIEIIKLARILKFRAETSPSKSNILIVAIFRANIIIMTVIVRTKYL